jgi:hypothetical protein
VLCVWLVLQFLVTTLLLLASFSTARLVLRHMSAIDESSAAPVLSRRNMDAAASENSRVSCMFVSSRGSPRTHHRKSHRRACGLAVFQRFDRSHLICAADQIHDLDLQSRDQTWWWWPLRRDVLRMNRARVRRCGLRLVNSASVSHSLEKPF